MIALPSLCFSSQNPKSNTPLLRGNKKNQKILSRFAILICYYNERPFKATETAGYYIMEQKLYQEMVKKYADTVYRIAINYTKSGFDADDVVQNVFLKLYTQDKLVQDGEHLKRWLIRVSINECKNLLAAFWRKNVVSIEEENYEPVFSTPEKSDLYDAVMELPIKYRIVIHLYYYEGYSSKEIASLLNIREQAVRTRLVRGRKMLKQQLKEVWQDE